MKRKKLIAFLVAVCIIATGCNPGTDDPDLPISDVASDTVGSESEDTSVTPFESIETTETETQTTQQTSESSKDTSKTTHESTTTDTETNAETSEEKTTTSESTTAESSVSQTTVQTPAATTTHTTSTTTTATTAATTLPAEPSPPTIFETTADGVKTLSNPLVTLDYSNCDKGYIMLKYTGSASKLKVQITGPTGIKQTYNMNSNGSYEAYNLTAGNGTYSIFVGENAGGNTYAQAAMWNIDVSLSSSLTPFLVSTRLVDFKYGDTAVTLASKLCGGTTNALQKVDRVYTWIVDNVKYDYDLAKSVQGGYEPDIERTINQKKGICYDYAGTMTAMLRSQGVPTQLVIGWAGTTYHAWVNVYVTDIGWVYGAIQFDGSGWHRLDPTFAASSGSSSAIMQYIGDGSNYVTEKLE